MKANLIQKAEANYWKKVTYRQACGERLSASPVNWCPAHSCDEGKCVMLELEGLEKAKAQKYSESELTEVWSNLFPFYFKDAKRVISKIRVCTGQYQEEAGSVPDKKQHYKIYEFNTPKPWNRIYGRGLKASLAIQNIWDLIVAIEERATISRQAFNDHLAVLTFPGSVREFLIEFSEQRKQKSNFEIDDPTAIDHEKDILFFKDYYHKHIVGLPIKSALERFIKDAYFERIQEFQKDKEFILCQNDRCNRLAVYFRGKLYCSPDREKRNCGQLAWKRKRYKKMKKISP